MVQKPRQVVVSNAPSCGGVAYAQERGIPTLRYPGRKDDPDALTPVRLLTSACRLYNG